MPADLPFYLIAAVTLAGAVAAMRLRNIVHGALCAAVSFAGLAAAYLLLDAQFAAFAQVLVYIGAIAILIVFTVLLTRGADLQVGAAIASPGWLAGMGVALLVLAAIAMPILASPGLNRTAAPDVQAPVKRIGEELMTTYVLPLEIIGLLLTAALIGAAVIALNEKPADSARPNNPTGKSPAKVHQPILH